MKKRAAGLLIAALLALGLFGLTSVHAEVKCVAWGGMDPVPTSEDAHTAYTENVPDAVQDVLAKAITSCTNEYDQVGFGVCVPPDPDVPCTDPT